MKYWNSGCQPGRRTRYDVIDIKGLKARVLLFHLQFFLWPLKLPETEYKRTNISSFKRNSIDQFSFLFHSRLFISLLFFGRLVGAISSTSPWNKKIVLLQHLVSCQITRTMRNVTLDWLRIVPVVITLSHLLSSSLPRRISVFLVEFSSDESPM